MSILDIDVFFTPDFSESSPVQDEISKYDDLPDIDDDPISDATLFPNRTIGVMNPTDKQENYYKMAQDKLSKALSHYYGDECDSKAKQRKPQIDRHKRSKKRGKATDIV